jgi:hypothetical protein
MPPKKIWTKTARQLLFETLVARFEPLAKWEKRTSPGNGLDQAYDEFCTAFAAVVGVKSGAAVKQQIHFAMPVRQGSWNSNGHSSTAVLNLAAAYEAGFIVNADFPDLLAGGRGSGTARKSRRDLPIGAGSNFRRALN